MRGKGFHGISKSYVLYYRYAIFLLLAATFLPVGYPLSLLAHEFWLERSDKDAVVFLSGHHDGGDGPERMQYDPGMVESVLCVTSSGSEKKESFIPEYPVRIPGAANCRILLLRTKPIHWTETAHGTLQEPRDRAKDPVHSWISIESVKRIPSPDTGDGSVKEGPVTQDLEIVALHSPRKVSVGDKVRLRVYYQGAPAPDLPVAYEGSTRGATDSAGEINIRIRHRGIQVMEVSKTIHLGRSDADDEVHTATLNFELSD